MSFLNRIWSIWWGQWTIWPKVISIAIVVIVLGLLIGFCKGEFKRSPKLNQVEIQKAQTAIATQDRKEMIEVLVQSDAREKAADASEIEANTVTVNAQAESRKQWANASNDEMAAELERRSHE